MNCGCPAHARFLLRWFGYRREGDWWVGPTRIADADVEQHPLLTTITAAWAQASEARFLP